MRKAAAPPYDFSIMWLVINLLTNAQERGSDPGSSLMKRKRWLRRFLVRRRSYFRTNTGLEIKHRAGEIAMVYILI